MTSLKRTSLRLALAAALFACTAGIASAATPDRVTHSVRVETADLNLTTQAGAEMLSRRIDRATREACGGRPAHGPAMLSQVRDYQVCRRAARTMAVASAENVGVRFADARPFTLAMRD